MVIKIKKLARDLQIQEEDLITRPLGKRMFEKVLENLEVVNENEVVLVDFEGIRVIDSSFVDEFIVNLLKKAREQVKPFYVKLKNISKISENNIDSVLKAYTYYNNQKFVVITEDICQDNNFFIGFLLEREKDIVDYLRLNESASFEDLSRFAEMNEKELFIILEGLQKNRLIRLSEKGGFYRSV